MARDRKRAKQRKQRRRKQEQQGGGGERKRTTPAESRARAEEALGRPGPLDPLQGPRLTDEQTRRALEEGLADSEAPAPEAEEDEQADGRVADAELDERYLAAPDAVDEDGTIEVEGERVEGVYADELEDLEEREEEPARERAVAPVHGGEELARDRGTRFGNFLRASWAELRRVQWPNRPQVGQGTAVTLVFVLIAGAYLGAWDAVFSRLIEAIL